MKAYVVIIGILAFVGAGVVVITIYLLFSYLLDEIKRLIRNLKRKCPRCYERVGKLDSYCKHCGKSLFEEVEE